MRASSLQMEVAVVIVAQVMAFVRMEQMRLFRAALHVPA